MRRLGLALLLLGLLGAPGRAVEEPCVIVEAALQDYRGALLARTSEGWAARQASFEALAAQYPGTVWGRRCAAVAAACAARAGHPTAWTAIARDPASSEALRYLAGRGLVGTDAALAAATLGPLARTPGALQPAAMLALGSLQRDPAMLAQVAVRYTSDPASEEACYLLGTELGQERWLMAYWRRYPEGRRRARVALALARTGGLDATTRLEVAGVLLDAAEYGPAAKLLTGLTSPLATFRAGRAAFRLGDYPRAEALLRSAARDQGLHARALVTLGQMEEKRKHVPQARAWYRAAAQGSDEAAREGLDRLAASYRRVDDESHASQVERELISRWPESEEATEGRWRELWRAYRRGDRAAARRWARDMGMSILVKVEGPGGAYWLGRFMEQDGELEGAQRLYEQILVRHPWGYYGWRSRMRLASVVQGAADPGLAVQRVAVRVRPEDLGGLVEACGGDARRSAYTRVLRGYPAALRELAYLGEGEPLFRAVQARGAGADLQAYAGLVANRPAEAIPLAELDETLRYPLPFYPEIQAAAALQGLEPLMLAALVKQESLFDPAARSWVGAMGLAQLMPDTARWVGKKVPGPVRALTDPFWNLKLGAYYLGYVGKRFPAQPALAVASYNAGPGAVRTWVERSGAEEIDAWVELIPYAETRHYVKKVFANLWNYQRIYREGV